MLKKLLVIFLILLSVYLTSIQIKEGFGASTGGALIQLHARGPQDSYLTDDSWRFRYPYFGYYEMPWWNSTRFTRNQLYDLRGYPW
tara:strand:- start:2245 stop:2502 length:258 start_codon:yes stop_codon:yes gene_type:complete